MLTHSLWRFWTNVRRVLKQRNQLLRNGSAYSNIQFGTKSFSALCREQVTEIRNHYVDSLNELLKGIIGEFLLSVDVKVSFTADGTVKRILQNYSKTNIPEIWPQVIQAAAP